ncbi:MAG: TonB-dependent receptor [Steroidobacteraceae bacterium]
MITTCRGRHLYWGLAAAALPLHPAAFAADGDSLALEEVVVTATRQEVELAKVPISLAVYTQDTMDRQSVRSVEDLARLTPGITFQRSNGGNTQATTISIRGISSGAGTATVGVYIDETPVQIRPDSLSSSNPYPQIFDLERVEILRGPQGTLFGAGSEGGTVRFITPEPSLTRFGVSSRSEVGFTHNGGTGYELGGAVGGPLLEDKLGLRVSGHYRRNSGWVDRINWNNNQVIQPDSNWDEVKSLRGALKWAVSDQLTLTPSVYYQDTNINDSSAYWEGYSNHGSRQFISANPVRTPTGDHFTLTALKTQYDFERVSLISNTSWLDRSNANVYDASTLDLATFTGQGFLRPPAPLSHFMAWGNLLDTQKVFTQEVRLQNSARDARLNWVVGAFYQHTKQHAEYFVHSPYLDDVLAYVGLPFRLGPAFYKGEYLLYSVGDLVNKELAGFVNLDFKLTDRLTLTGGVRVSRNQYDSASFGAGPVLGGESRNSVSSTETPVTPKLGVSFQVNDGNMLYASVAKGYRQGSATGRVSNSCQADALALGIELGPRQILPDYVWSYEIGSKNRLLDGRMSLDTSVYQINWSRIQSSLFLPNCNVPITANFGDATSRGFDFSLNYAASASTLLGLSVGYSDADYTSDTRGANNVIIRPKGEPLPIAPWTVAVSGQQTLNLLGHESYLRADFQYRSKNTTPVPVGLPAVDPTIPRAPSSKNLDLRWGVKFGEGADVSLFMANALDDAPSYSRNRDNQTTFNYRAVTVRPRTVGLTATYRY